jgi:cardiolipin synthase
MNAANTVTVCRIVMIPVFGTLWWRGNHVAALVVFAAAGLSDLLDGFLARVLDQKTKLGQFLDPAADKFMVLVGYLVAAKVRALPVWLAAVVIGRDVLQALGAAGFYLFARDRLGPERWKPTKIGKYAAFQQVLTVGLALLGDAATLSGMRPYVAALGLVAALLTVCAAAQYLGRAALALSGRVPAGGAA